MANDVAVSETAASPDVYIMRSTTIWYVTAVCVALASLGFSQLSSGNGLFGTLFGMLPGEEHIFWLLVTVVPATIAFKFLVVISTIFSIADDGSDKAVMPRQWTLKGFIGTASIFAALVFSSSMWHGERPLTYDMMFLGLHYLAPSMLCAVCFVFGSAYVISRSFWTALRVSLGLTLMIVVPLDLLAAPENAPTTMFGTDIKSSYFWSPLLQFGIIGVGLGILSGSFRVAVILTMALWLAAVSYLSVSDVAFEVIQIKGVHPMLAPYLLATIAALVVVATLRYLGTLWARADESDKKSDDKGAVPAEC